MSDAANGPDRMEALSRLRGGPRLRLMSDVAEERAALLALLEERPQLRGEEYGKTSWSTIASETSMLGWERFHPPALGADSYLLAFADNPDDANLLLKQAMETVHAWEESADFDMVTILEAKYPVALSEIHQMPPMLFFKGDLRTDDVGVSVVGSRKPSERGRSIARHVAEGLVNRGISVISGLAAGIDGLHTRRRWPRADVRSASSVRVSTTCFLPLTGICIPVSRRQACWCRSSFPTHRGAGRPSRCATSPCRGSGARRSSSRPARRVARASRRGSPWSMVVR
jgi:hypothetical protein